MRSSDSQPDRRTPASQSIPIESLESRRLMHGGASDFHVQFGPARLTPVEGYVVDAGAVFSPRNQDGTLSYGWTKKGSAKPVLRRHSDLAPDARYDAFTSLKPGATWELEVHNGTYTVHLVAGDAKARRGAYGLDVEGTPAIRGDATAEQRWLEGTVTVTVTDGRLTVSSAEGFRKNRLNFIDVTEAAGGAPGTNPTPTPTPNPDPTPTPTPTPPVTPSPNLDAWRAGAASPIARAEAVGAAVNGKLYVFGGIDGNGSNYQYPITGRSDAYDPATNTWTRLPDMPEPFTHSGPAVDGSVIWFPGSFVGDTPGPGTTHVWKFDTAINAWSRGPDLPEARGGGAAAIVGRQLHYFGGSNADRTADMPTHWALDLDAPAATWVRKADMPGPRNHMAGTTAGGKIYAVGGQAGEGDEAVDLADVHVYDPATNSWQTAAPMPGPRSHTNSSTLPLGDKLLVIGGESGPEMYQPEILLYDPATNGWSTFALLPEPRSTAIAGIINGEIVLSTGNAPDRSAHTWIAKLV